MSSPAPPPEMVTLTIDGRQVQAARGSYVLAAARAAGIGVPTLCEHPELEPVGACRLCMVEVTHPDWRGWSGLMTSCLYPVSEGLQVQTDSPRVHTSRRQTLALLAARCPGSETIAKLAQRYGAETGSLRVDTDRDLCILCGLCTRVCETFATSAITTFNRGSAKAVGAFWQQAPDECVGCGACAQVCPTGNIAAQRTATGYEIWQRTFATAVCAVEPPCCVGCGSCEQSCPWGVARVKLRAGQTSVATIPSAHCRGCGACVDACPTGAIDQQIHDWQALSKTDQSRAHGVAVFACGRANLGAAELGDSVALLEVPCVGRVSTALLLARLAQGARGVLVLGRNQKTCRLDGGEDSAEERTRRADRAAALVGLGSGRLQYRVARPGPAGPTAQLHRFLADVDKLGPTPLGQASPAERFPREGLDSSLAALRWLSEQLHEPPEHGGQRDDVTVWEGFAPADPSGPLLFAGSIPHLDVLGEHLWQPLRLPELVRQALAVLARLGKAEPTLALSGCGVVRAADAARWRKAPALYAWCAQDQRCLGAVGLEATVLDELLRSQGSELPRPPIEATVACDGTPQATELVQALGYRPVSVGPDPLPDRFALSAELGAAADQRLAQAQQQGAVALLVSGPAALARWALLCRHGSWRSHAIVPICGVTMAWLSCAALPLGGRISTPAHEPYPLEGAAP